MGHPHLIQQQETYKICSYLIAPVVGLGEMKITERGKSEPYEGSFPENC